MARNRAVTIICWVARIWSVASLGFVGAFLIGEGPPPLDVRHMFFPFGILLGLVLAWRFEKTGGFVAALSIVLFYAIHYAESGRLPGGPWFLLIAAPGLLFLGCGCLRPKSAKDTDGEPGAPPNAGSATQPGQPTV